MSILSSYATSTTFAYSNECLASGDVLVCVQSHAFRTCTYVYDQCFPAIFSTLSSSL